MPRVELRLGRALHGERKDPDLSLAMDLLVQAQRRLCDVVFLVTSTTT